jgi:hypothetical protein
VSNYIYALFPSIRSNNSKPYRACYCSTSNSGSPPRNSLCIAHSKRLVPVILQGFEMQAMRNHPCPPKAYLGKPRTSSRIRVSSDQQSPRAEAGSRTCKRYGSDARQVCPRSVRTTLCILVFFKSKTLLAFLSVCPTAAALDPLW